MEGLGQSLHIVRQAPATGCVPVDHPIGGIPTMEFYGLVVPLSEETTEREDWDR